MKAGTLFTPEDIFEKIERCLPYIRPSNGGVTLSGGEPLLQPDFIIGLFKICRKNLVHTAIDTSAFYHEYIDPGKIDEVIKLTDLFIVDIKASNVALNKKISYMELKGSLSFINKLERKKMPYWLRYVLVPGLNDSDKDINDLKNILGALRHCKKFEFLPYHTLGKHKWKHMGVKYPLEGFRPASHSDTKSAMDRLLNPNLIA